MTEDEKDKDDLAKTIPLLNLLGKKLQKAAAIQSELRKHYPLMPPPIDGSRPSQRRVDCKKRPSLGRLLDDINELSKVPKERVYHELVRAPDSRARAKQTRLKAGNISRRGVKEAIKWCNDQTKEPRRGNIKQWFIKNNYALPSDSHLSKLISQELLIIQK